MWTWLTDRLRPLRFISQTRNLVFGDQNKLRTFSGTQGVWIPLDSNSVRLNQKAVFFRIPAVRTNFDLEFGFGHVDKQGAFVQNEVFESPPSVILNVEDNFAVPVIFNIGTSGFKVRFVHVGCLDSFAPMTVTPKFAPYIDGNERPLFPMERLSAVVPYSVALVGIGTGVLSFIQWTLQWRSHWASVAVGVVAVLHFLYRMFDRTSAWVSSDQA